MDDAQWEKAREKAREGQARATAASAALAMEFGATPDQIVAALKSAGLEVVLVTPELRELLDEVSAYSKSSGGLLWLEDAAEEWAESAQGVAWREGAE
jgi:hypothetical protein